MKKPLILALATTASLLRRETTSQGYTFERLPSW